MHHYARAIPISLKRLLRTTQHEVLATKLGYDRGDFFCVSAKGFGVVNDRLYDNVSRHADLIESMAVTLNGFRKYSTLCLAYGWREPSGETHPPAMTCEGEGALEALDYDLLD